MTMVAGQEDQPAFLIVTIGASAAIPDLGALGTALPASSEYRWSVVGFAPASSVDALAGPDGLGVISDEWHVATAASRSFTTP